MSNDDVPRVLPLPKGEGRGEGKGPFQSRVGSTQARGLECPCLFWRFHFEQLERQNRNGEMKKGGSSYASKSFDPHLVHKPGRCSLPLPKGEGRGEGEQALQSRVGSTQTHGSSV